jgi:hypothetical protein
MVCNLRYIAPGPDARQGSTTQVVYAAMRNYRNEHDDDTTELPDPVHGRGY